MEIRPASFAQIAAGRNGQMVQINDDVQGVANALAEIDHRIRLRFSEAGGYYVIYWLPDEWEEGDGYLVFTATELDHRLVHHMREVFWRCQQPGYSFADELEATEAEKKREDDHGWTERTGEMHEKLAHALREDAGYNKGKIFVPEDIPV